MPWMGRFDLFQISLLLLCVPAQYLISIHFGSSVVGKDRDQLLQTLVIKFNHFAENYLSLQRWNDWAVNVGEVIKAVWNDRRRIVIHEETDQDPRRMKSEPDSGESAAKEVTHFRINQGYFASSKLTRFPKTDDVQFCVGQVVRHKLLGYRGVIVGWDPVAKAPETWLTAMHPADKKHWRSMPNYAILVDTRDRSDPQMTYVPQENLEVLTNVETRHPEIDDYFMAYTGDIFIPQKWLRKIYPAD